MEDASAAGKTEQGDQDFSGPVSEKEPVEETKSDDDSSNNNDAVAPKDTDDRGSVPEVLRDRRQPISAYTETRIRNTLGLGCFLARYPRIYNNKILLKSPLASLFFQTEKATNEKLA
jgi:hypothetical protein